MPELQRREHRVRELDHRRHVGQHARLEERRLNEPPLAEPKIAFTGDETVAEHWFEGPRTEVLNVVLGVGDQHLLDKLGIAGEEQPPAANPEAGQWTVGPGQIEEEVDAPRTDLSNMGKNSADIRMVVDALDLCYTKEHIDTFVIISGNSDFSPLVSKLRENAKTVIGVGVKNSTSDLLISNCDEFIYYDTWCVRCRPHARTASRCVVHLLLRRRNRRRTGSRSH